MVKILLLSAGTNACYHCAKILKQNFFEDFYIVGADINDRHLVATCNYFDAFYKVPPATDEKYIQIIFDICAKEKIDYMLPSFDLDQKYFYPENEKLQQIGVRSLAACFSTLQVYENKKKMGEFLQNNGFPTPRSYRADETEAEKIYFTKPADGVGSIGARMASGTEIRAMDNADCLIQELCYGPEYTVECFNYSGKYRCVTRERIAAKAGVCTKTKVFNHPELEKITGEFAGKFKCPYCFNLQFMKNSNNDYVITDVNLRLAGGMSLSYAAGWDEISALAKVMLNKPENEIFETLPEKIQPQYIVRAYTDIVTKIEKPTVAFDFDGTLLDSRERHRIVLNDILKQYNINLDTSDLIEYKRDGKNNISYLISKGIDESLSKEIQAEWIENIEKEEYLEIDVLYQDTIETLEKYSEENDLILVTARNNKGGLQNQIGKFGLRKYFKEIFIVKPDKTTADLKAEILKKENAVKFIGDTSSDKKAACIARVEFVHFDKGFHSRDVVGTLMK